MKTMKKTLIISTIATPILTLGILVGINTVSAEAYKVKEAIQVASTAEVTPIIEKDSVEAIQEAPAAPQATQVTELPTQALKPQQAPSAFPKEDFRAAMFNESERLSPEKTIRMNSMELVSIAMRNIPDLTTEDVALNMLRECKAFYSGMQTGSQEYSQARYNQACS